MAKPLPTNGDPAGRDGILTQATAHAVKMHLHGMLVEAETLYRKVLNLQPKNFFALHLCGVLKHQQGHDAEAFQLISSALRLDPQSADAWSSFGTVLNALGRCDEALQAFRKALSIDPAHVESLTNRARPLLSMGRPEESLATCDRALAIMPGHFTALNNRGNALLRLNRPDEALAAYDDAVVVKPDFVEALNNRGNALTALNRLDEALVAYQAALAINSTYLDALWNEALAQLCVGNFATGWKGYECRWQRKELLPCRRNFPQPLWLGDQPIGGKTILIHAEQGLGDTLQFVRYVPLVAAMGAKVVLEVQPPLLALCERLAGACAIVGHGSVLPPFDLHCPLLSLPLALGTRLDSIPASVPYISVPADRVGAWSDRLPPTTSVRVGLVWSGNPDHPNDFNRSIALQRLRPVISEPGIQFVSLQKDVLDADAAVMRDLPGLIHLGAELRDFADTAAVISQLDLVISVDTSVAHLAGALGRPVWILLPFTPEFRWLLDRADSPWYPSARLFRQPGIGDWDSVIVPMRDALRSLRDGAKAE